MKKILCIAVIFICLYLSACGESGQKNKTAETGRTKRVYVTGISEGSSVVTDDELDLVYHYGEREDAPKYIDIEFEDIAIHGVYEETRYMPDYNCDYDVYSFTDGDGLNCGVEKNVKTGEIVSFSRFKEVESTENEAPKTTREERLGIAGKYLKKYTNGKYNLSSERVPEVKESFHSFLFRRVISGLPTADEVRITVNTDGEFCCISKVVSPAFYDTESLEIDMEECEALATERAIGITGTENVTVISGHVMHLKDGKYGVEYKIEYPTELPNGYTGTQAVWLFVYA